MQIAACDCTVISCALLCDVAHLVRSLVTSFTRIVRATLAQRSVRRLALHRLQCVPGEPVLQPVCTSYSSCAASCA